MASLGTQTGFWIDWTDGRVLGSSITLTVRSSNILIAIASLWVGNLLASWVWATIATTIYRQRSKTKVRDGVHVQHQLIWRNSGDPLTAATENLIVGIKRSRSVKWLTQKIDRVRKWTPRKSASGPTAITSNSKINRSIHPKFDRIGRRTLCACSTPFLIWAVFFVAGVFVSYIAVPNHDVLATSDPASCGIWNISAANLPNQHLEDAHIKVENAYSLKVLNDTLNGRSYARSCYANDLGNLNPVSCSIYTKSTLQYFFVQDNLSCPFRNHPDEPFAGGACDAPLSKGAFAMWTGRLDSSVDLGINAPSKHAVGFEKKANCSVVSLVNRTGTSNNLGPDTQANVTWSTYQFGGLRGYVGGNVTYFIDVAASQSNNYGYQVKAVYSYADVPGQDWTPAAPFDLEDGDVSLFFFAANSVCYLEKVYDPYFLATDPYQIPIGLSKPLLCYNPVNPVAVMGCVDQYSICDSSKADAQCTEPGGIVQLASKLERLDLNLHQYVTAVRIFHILQNSDTYSSVYGTGTAALKASDKIIGVLASGLPPYQWKIEALGWFQTSLAKMQAYAVEFVSNTANIGPFGRVSFPGYNSSTLPIWQEQCRSQRIANTGQYQVFSFLGIMILFCLAIHAFCLKIATEYSINKKRTPGDVYLADNKFQLQRMVLDIPVLNSRDEVPVYDPSYVQIRLSTPSAGGGVTYLSQQSSSAQQPTPGQILTSSVQPSGHGASATGAPSVLPISHTLASASQVTSAAQSGTASQSAPAQAAATVPQVPAPVTQTGTSHSTLPQTGSSQTSQP